MRANGRQRQVQTTRKFYKNASKHNGFIVIPGGYLLDLLFTSQPRVGVFDNIIISFRISSSLQTKAERKTSYS